MGAHMCHGRGSGCYFNSVLYVALFKKYTNRKMNKEKMKKDIKMEKKYLEHCSMYLGISYNCKECIILYIGNY